MPCAWNITSPPDGKAKPGARTAPRVDRSGEVGRRHFGHDQDPRDKVGGGLEPWVEARWGACQKTVRGADCRLRRAYLETPRHLVHLSRAPMSDSSRPPRPRALFVAALLLLTLALAGAIALQAYRNFLGHRATAERVLRDYSRLAAARFAQRTEMAVYWSVFSPAIDALSRAKANLPDTPLPPPASLPAPIELHSADFRKLARYTFRYDLLSGRLETAGATPSLGVRKWLRDTLPVHSRTVYDPKERLGAIVRTMEGVPRAIVYTAVLDKAGHPRTLVG